MVRHIVLNGENVGELAVEPFRPQVPAGGRVDELGRDPHPIARFAHAAFEDVTHAEALTDLGDMDVLALEGERRISRDDEQRRELRERGDDVFRDAVGEIFLLGVAAHIGERQNRNRRLVGQGGRPRHARRLDVGRPGWLLRNRRPHPQGVDAHRLGDVLERRSAEIADSKIEPGLHLPIGVLGETNGAGLGDAFEASGDVDAVAHEVAVAFFDHVAQMNADAEFDPPVFGHTGVALGMAVWISRAQRTASTTLRNSTISPSPVRLTTRPLRAAMVGSRRSLRNDLSRASVPSSSTPASSAIADHIGREDRCKLTCLRHPRPLPVPPNIRARARCRDNYSDATGEATLRAFRRRSRGRDLRHAFPRPPEVSNSSSVA